MASYSRLIMAKALKTIVFFGSGPVAAASLSSLANHFSVEAVITKASPKHHKGQAPVEALAKELNLPIYFANSKSDLDDLFNKEAFSSLLGVVVDYGVIISNRVINSFKFGILNSHFSLLPEWRGADPITFSILSGQQKTGVSLMLIDESLDTGKLLTRKSIGISQSDDVVSLTKKLIDFSNRLLNEYIPKYLDGSVKPKNQPHPDRATYSRKITKDDGIIDWQKPAEQIERDIRAYQGWPKSHTSINGNNIIIIKSHVISTPEDKLDVKCGDKKYLSIDELIAPSGRKMSAKDFINGYRIN